ncbi:MAG: aminodeoxychorismate synthase component I [Myxococcota bacterium]|nr:aminodeoxychorismate synthase component I [Myxococcota bacterium]
MRPISADPHKEFVQLRWRELAGARPDLLAVSEELQADSFGWLLDSATPAGRLGRYSFAGSDPYLVARVSGERIELNCRREVRAGFTPGLSERSAGIFDWLQEALPSFAVDLDGLPFPFPFIGGAVGYWGYELAEQVETLKLNAHDDLGLPDASVLFVDRLVALDHASGRAFALGLGFGRDKEEARRRAGAALAEFSDRLAEGGCLTPSARPETGPPIERATVMAMGVPDEATASFAAEGYRERVGWLKEEIASGNVYEANLTRRMDLPFDGAPWPLYRALRMASPAPFASFLDLPEGAVLGSSPERFLRLSSSGQVESRPIKGTRPRGLASEEDMSLAKELATSEKDRAENLMIVDLVRNDLGRVCKTGTISVPELMQVESYASVFQLVSTVVGQLREGSDRMDLFRAAFPPGSMTGAPKIAAMRLLNEIEPVRRGVYSGALGYLDLRGGMDLAVVIRTILICKDRAHFHVGGAVVADSDPQREYEESLDKAKGMLAALEAERQSRTVPREPERAE